MPRWLVSVLGLAAAVGLALVARSLRPRPPLPVLGQVPAFALQDEKGAPYTTQSMLGHATVADFIFTACRSSCPRLTAQMAKLQGMLEHDRSGARLVSFSVDPETDTPPVLAAYASKAGADAARWSFVTGPVDDVIKTVVQGFKISAAKVARGANDYDVTHGDWFVLVDRSGQIRGYYATDEDGALGRLAADVERLEAGGAGR